MRIFVSKQPTCGAVANANCGTLGLVRRCLVAFIMLLMLGKVDCVTGEVRNDAAVPSQLEREVKEFVHAMGLGHREQEKAAKDLRALGILAVPYMIKYIDDFRLFPSSFMTIESASSFEGKSMRKPRTVAAAVAYLIIERVIIERSRGSQFTHLSFEEAEYDNPTQETILKWRTWCAENWPEKSAVCWNK